MSRMTWVLMLVVAVSACAPSVAIEEHEAVVQQLEQLESEVGSLRDRASQVSQENQALESRLAASEDENRVLQEQLDTLTTELGDLREERNGLSSEVISLRGKVSLYECDRSLSGMQYANILDSSTILSSFVAQQSFSQRAQGTFRDSIWGNADSKLHGIRYIDAQDNQSYTTYFMVYFDEFGFDEGVFWIDRQCWLER